VSSATVGLSIIIPTRDRPGLLRDCLRTIQRQQVGAESVEVVVIDDGSLQPLQPVVADARGEISIRCIRQAPAGLNAARNRGIEVTSGEAVAFLDDDTLLSPQWARTVLATFESSACAAMGGRVRLEFEGGSAPAWLARTQREYLAEFDLGPEPLWLDYGPDPVGANCAVRRAEFDRVGPFRDGLDRIGSSLVSNGDTEFFRRLRRRGGRVRYEPAAAAIHRVSAERLTREFFLRRAHAQGVSDALLAAGAHPDLRVARLAREVWRCGRTGPILIRGLATGHGTMNARQWASYCRGRLGATVAGR
jgi:glucosyl-dolichyl phosphate glucuronosyltransferase